ncbi:hypothetical protein AK830_g8503 [Neonectria ditissima]|uniref:non-specific serine/threonine protein kinase n=1 Tax=Neonectria ditissima TaxID=78410 RepID=A0A0P7BC59_9HYPO|nr:hypothetical protein AK830_g8503 [Neonectria ditissima]
MSPQHQDDGQRPRHQQTSNQHHRVPDLVRDSQLITRFFPDGSTQHTVHVTSNHASRRRRIRVEETWHPEREIGNGTFGRVWLQRCGSGPATGSLRAVKEMQKDPSLPVDYTRELEAMAKFSHEKYVHCFVKCHGWYTSENMVFIAMEHLEHGDLQKHLNKPFPEGQVKEIASQLAEGLVYLHDNGFAHRDLKPPNILVHRPGPDWWVKIGDFGISKRADPENTALRTLIGTEGYLAPEVIGFVFNQDSSPTDPFSYTFAVDMWALGEIMFRLIAHRPAFVDRQDLFNCVVHGHPFPTSTLQANDASEDCCDFIMKCMAAQPGKRLTAHEATEHVWVQTSRPSSRASSGSSVIKSEVLTISTNPSVQNAHQAGRPATSELNSPFVDTAQWSTGTQQAQYKPLTSPFESTAQWSTGLLEPQQPQAVQQSSSASTPVRPNGADIVSSTSQELPSRQLWIDPPTPSLTPQLSQSTRPLGMLEAVKYTLDLQDSAIQQPKTLAPRSRDAQGTSTTDALMKSTQPPITDVEHLAHSGSIMDEADINSGKALSWDLDSLPSTYYPNKSQEEQSLSLSKVAEKTPTAKGKVKAAKLGAKSARRRQEATEVEPRRPLEMIQRDKQGKWFARQIMEQPKLARRKRELFTLQNEYETLRPEYEPRSRQKDKAEREARSRAPGYTTPPLQGAFEAEPRKLEQWKLAEREGYENLSTGSKGEQRSQPKDTVEFDAFSPSSMDIDTPNPGTSASNSKDDLLDFSQHRVDSQTRYSQPDSGRHLKSISDSYLLDEVDIKTEGDILVKDLPKPREPRISTISTYKPPPARLVTSSPSFNRESTETARRVRQGDGSSPLHRLSNLVPSVDSSLKSLPPLKMLPAPFPPDFTQRSTGPSAIMSPASTSSTSTPSINTPMPPPRALTPPPRISQPAVKKLPVSTHKHYKLPAHAPPAVSSPDFVLARRHILVPKPTSFEIAAGIARLDKLDRSWRNHIGKDLHDKGLDNDTVKQNFEFIADVLEERRQVRPYLETPAPPPSPAAELARISNVDNARDTSQRDQDSGPLSWEITPAVARGDRPEQLRDTSPRDRDSGFLVGTITTEIDRGYRLPSYSYTGQADDVARGDRLESLRTEDLEELRKRRERRDIGFRGWLKKKFVP